MWCVCVGCVRVCVGCVCVLCVLGLVLGFKVSVLLLRPRLREGAGGYCPGRLCAGACVRVCVCVCVCARVLGVCVRACVRVCVVCVCVCVCWVC